MPTHSQTSKWVSHLPIGGPPPSCQDTWNLLCLAPNTNIDTTRWGRVSSNLRRYLCHSASRESASPGNCRHSQLNCLLTSNINKVAKLNACWHLYICICILSIHLPLLSFHLPPISSHMLTLTECMALSPVQWPTHLLQYSDSHL